MSFQEGIDAVLSRQGVDIAIFILWSRMGSPVGASIRKPDGSQYLSGTEREFDLMLRSRLQSRATEGTPRPAMLVYTRQDDASFNEKLRNAGSIERQKDLIHQKELMDNFLHETFQDKDSGTNIGAYSSFDRPVTFSHRLRVHLQAKLDEIAGGIQDAVWDIGKQGPPFLGLEAFLPEHADIFFGREDEILEGINAIREQARNGCAFLLLSGASGSGKSSLAMAGLIPEIIRLENATGIGNNVEIVWKTLLLNPSGLGNDPVFSLLSRMTDPGILPSLAGRNADLAALADDLAADPQKIFRYTIKGALETASVSERSEARLLIVVDQLEELFSSSTVQPEKRREFLNVLETFARSGLVWIVATIRSDFYHHIQNEPSLVRMKEGRGLLDVLPPGPDALQRLIEEPARLAGLTFELRNDQPLSNRILKDAASHAELLPLVEFVLRELFEKRTDQNVLTYSAYESLGGVEGALASRAEKVFNDLPPASRKALDPVLRSLVTVGYESEEGGNHSKAVRQRASFSAFAGNDDARLLIDRFIAARLFTACQTDVSREPAVTVAHESLLRVWNRAIEWRKDDIDFLRARARIASRMKEDSPLLSGDPLLRQAEDYLNSHRDGFTPAQRDWVEAAVNTANEARTRTAKIRRHAFIALSTLTVVAVTGAIVAFISNRQSVAARKIAEEETRRSERFSQMVGDAHQSSSQFAADLLIDLRAKLSPDGGETAFQDAKALVDEHLAEPQIPGDGPDSLHMQSVVLNSRGYLARKTGDFASAGKFYRDSLAIREKLLAMDPAKPLYRHNVAMAYDNLGDLYISIAESVSGQTEKKRENLDAAVLEYRKALEIIGKLAAEDLKSTQWQDDLAISHFKVADALFNEGEPEAALGEFMKGYPISLRLAEMTPPYAKWRAHLGLYCLMIGKANALLARIDVANEYLFKGRDVFADLERNNQLTQDYRRWSKEIETTIVDLQ